MIRKLWILLFLLLLSGTAFYFWSKKDTTLIYENKDEAQQLASDLELLNSGNPSSADLRASLGRMWKLDSENAKSLSRKWLERRPDDKELQEMLLLTSVELNKENALHILDRLLPKPSTARLQEMRLELRLRVDPRSTLEDMPASEKNNPRVLLTLVELGNDGPEVAKQLLNSIHESKDSVLVLRALKLLVADPNTSKEALALAHAQVVSDKTAPELRVALYRMLESRKDTLLSKEFMKSLMNSLPHNNRIQLSRAMVLRCRKDREELLAQVMRDYGEPLKTVVRDLLRDLKKHDPCSR